ncbi:hypothetical protein FOMPIDRAFT_1021423 [Fomitopsis schrenkii]|uniref:Uncharacterized protein n=1 Tax=Fomitopsis schrenkii TaxID=2126942 RepID=S8EKW6_FOMSC|nr:hypothetical protein FOMPIDRAFT_1021423 [Fomitopsis schrenkii]
MRYGLRRCRQPRLRKNWQERSWVMPRKLIQYPKHDPMMLSASHATVGKDCHTPPNSERIPNYAAYCNFSSRPAAYSSPHLSCIAYRWRRNASGFDSVEM